MKIGYTGTRAGLTWLQRSKTFARLSLLHSSELHHGDCIGGDAEAHEMGLRRRHRIVIHPPTNPKQRAYCKSATWSTSPVSFTEAKPYLKRNEDIVNQTECLIANPKEKEEQRRGSITWATIRYALKVGKTVYIIYPDGTEVLRKGRKVL